MWTEAHRARHDARLKEIVSLNAVAQVARWLERADPPRSGRATPYGAVVRAIAWHLRIGGPWRALPPGWPPWRTVYGWFRRWLALGLFDALLREVARRRRRKGGRRPGPTLAIVDTQAVKCIAVRGPRGYDAGKKVLGRKRVALVDAEGHWLAVAVVPASVQDRDTLEALDAGKARWPTLREGIYDAAFAAERWGLSGIRCTGVRRPPAVRPQGAGDRRRAQAPRVRGTDAVEQLGVARELGGVAHRPDQRVPAPPPAGPAARDLGVLRGAGHGDLDPLQQQPDDLLALRGRGGRRAPQGRDVLGQAADRLAVGHGEARRLAGEEARVFLPQPGLGGQRRLPALLQGAGHEPVLRLDGVVLPLGALDLVARLLQPQRPLPLPLRPLDLDVPGQLQADLDRRRPQPLEDEAGDELVERAPAEGLAAEGFNAA